MEELTVYAASKEDELDAALALTKEQEREVACHPAQSFYDCTQPTP